jgi:hypothetical protein
MHPYARRRSIRRALCSSYHPKKLICVEAERDALWAASHRESKLAFFANSLANEARVQRCFFYWIFLDLFTFVFEREECANGLQKALPDSARRNALTFGRGIAVKNIKYLHVKPRTILDRLTNFQLWLSIETRGWVSTDAVVHGRVCVLEKPQQFCSWIANLHKVLTRPTILKGCAGERLCRSLDQL